MEIPVEPVETLESVSQPEETSSRAESRASSEKETRISDENEEADIVVETVETTDTVESAAVAAPVRKELLLMDSEEEWRCADSFEGRHELEDEFWTRGFRLRQSAFIIELLKEFDISKQLQEFCLVDVTSFIRDGLQLDISDEAKALDEASIVSHLTTELLLWKINGSNQLRLQLIQIRKWAVPEWTRMFDAFGLPCQYIHAHRLLNEHRYCRVPRRNARNSEIDDNRDDDSAFSELEMETEVTPPMQPQMPDIVGLFEKETDFGILPLDWPDFKKEIEHVMEHDNESVSFSRSSSSNPEVDFSAESEMKIGIAKKGLNQSTTSSHSGHSTTSVSTTNNR